MNDKKLIEHKFKSCPDCGCTNIERMIDLIEADNINENCYVCMNDNGCNCNFYYTGNREEF